MILSKTERVTLQCDSVQLSRCYDQWCSVVAWGHSDIGVTMKEYTHLGLEDADAEMARMKLVQDVRREQEKISGETGSSEMT